MPNLVKAMTNLQKAFTKAGDLGDIVQKVVEALAKEDPENPLTVESTHIEPQLGLMTVFFEEDLVPLWKILRIAAALDLDVTKMEFGLVSNGDFDDELCLTIDLNPEPPEEG